MKTMLRLVAIVAAVTVGTTTGNAGTVSFSGVLSGVDNGASPNFPWLTNGDPFSVSLTFADTGTDSSTISNSTLTINTLYGVKTITGNTGTISIAGSPTVATISIGYTGTFGGGQPSTANLNFTMTSIGTINPLQINQANMASIFGGYSSYSGTISNLVIGDFANSRFGQGSASFNGTIPVPEPGSIGLLTGLGCVVGRRLWRRRQQKQADAAV